MAELDNAVIESYTKIVLEDYQRRIDDLKDEITMEQENLEYIESSMKNYSLETPSDYPDAINDVEDKKKLIIFFNDQIGLWGLRTYAPGLFHNKSNIPFLCVKEKLVCPQWYIDKYYPSLDDVPIFRQFSSV